MWNILIADDEMIERQGMESLLLRRGLPMQIYHAADGEEALVILEKEKIDILITDVKMPRLNGLELCRRIRQTDQQLFIIMQSAYDDFAFMRQAIQMHVDDYILKPITISEFDMTIDKAMAAIGESRSAEPETLTREGKIVKEVLGLIEEHYGENIGLEWIADQVRLSAGYLSGLFKTEYGQGITQYLIAYRMEKAKQLLCNTNLRIGEVAERVGYPNQSYFCQQFRRYHGITPNSIRENPGK